MLIMMDSINVAAIPRQGLAATAGYVNGWWPNSAAMASSFPDLPHVSIAVTADVDADALDVERGDATVDQAPGWVDRQHARGKVLPVVYGSAADVTALRRALGGRDYLLWAAHYTGTPHLCGTGCGYPPADATQFWDRGPHGENVDQTLMSERFYEAIGGAVAASPAITPPITPPATPAPLRKAHGMIYVTQKEEGTWALGPGYRHELDLTELHALFWDANPPASMAAAIPFVTLEDGPIGQTRFWQLVSVWTQPNTGAKAPATTTTAGAAPPA